MAVLRSAILVSATLATPAALMKPPLATGGGNKTPTYAVNRLSPLAAAGRTLYNKLCTDCHGANGTGTAHGPSLADVASKRSQKARKVFHQVVRKGAPAGPSGMGSMPAFRLSFNRIEMIGRFLREIHDRRR